MTSGSFRFDQFLLDAGDRQLLRAGQAVEINSRYLDALALLVREQGRLVSKDRFLDEVWRGVPVTDEALTQCIRTLRRLLGDDAASPRFIETVPKHGYRFIAPVNPAQESTAIATWRPNWRDVGILSAAGTVGGGVAGFIGGLVYGFAAASDPESGGLSVLLVIQCLTIVVAIMGGAGVSFGIALAGYRDWRWSIAGGAAGGLFVGAVVKLLGIDAFHLLFGHAPAGITGAMEGALLGAGTGLGVWLAARSAKLRRGIFGAALAGAVTGAIVPLLNGRLMGGSLDLLARSFPNSRLRLDALSALFGEQAYGPITQFVTGALEGALFSACVAAAMVLARRGLVRGLGSPNA